MINNPLLNTDSYKVSMWKQYPPGTTGVYSYIEARKSNDLFDIMDSTVFFGLQAFLKKYLSKPITRRDIDAAETILTKHGEPFNRAGWEHILNVHKGYLPVVIRAVPEGMVIPRGNALVTIENTDPFCFWLTTWLETSLLRAVWYPTTVATVSKNIKNIIHSFLQMSGDESGLAFKLHDFGARGVSSLESAALGGAAHLINFMGTDTISGILAAIDFYKADVCGFSIPAAEHSTITSWGENREVDAYRNMLNQFAKPGSIVAVVSDSYDIMNATENLWGEQLRDQVISSGATVVIRPDSGDPIDVCSKVVKILDAKFGHTINSKGYKVLNHVRVIQGDGVNDDTITLILADLTGDGFSADNIAFGMGGALLQHPNRDTMRFAMKCSSVEVNGEWVDVYKNPVTDLSKQSKKGRVSLFKNGGEFVTAPEPPKTWRNKTTSNTWEDVLVEVFRDGHITKEYTFEEVRKNSNL